MTQTLELAEEIHLTARQWLESRVDKFDPLSHESGASKQLRRKAFAEAALVVYTADRLETVTPVEGLEELLISRCNDRQFYQLLLRNPGEVRLYGPALAYVHSIGELDSGAVEALQTTLKRDAAWAKERKPYELLDMVHLCRLAGVEGNVSDMEQIIQFGAQCNPPELIDSKLETVYGLTHNVIFWHHFGFPHPEFPAEPAPHDADSSYRGLITRFLAAENYDILLELVLCGVLQRAISPTTVTAVFRSLQETTEELGYVPGPEIDGDGLVSAGLADSIDTQESTEVDTHWKQNYHTNILAFVVTRIIQAQWEEFVEETTAERYECTTEEITALGTVLESLAAYDLKAGAQRLTEIGDADICEQFPDVVSDIVTYLRQQRVSDGDYGYWTDERLLFEQNEDYSGSFTEQLVEPISESCETAIETVKE